MKFLLKKHPGVFVFLFSVIFTIAASAQKAKLLNLPTYDVEKLHFGFSLAVNRSDFTLIPQKAGAKPDSVLSVEALADWGFNLAIISDLRIHEFATLRVLPTLAFQDRRIEYRIDSSNVPGINPYVEKKKIESTLLDFPINLKIRSQRLNNFSAYLIGGGKYSIDLASQEGVNNPDIVKLTKYDLSYEVGFGVDFYLQYFKLSTEIKFAHGFRDRLVHEPTVWSSSISKLYTKTWLFSINFEG